jgi:hypothetical protein
MSTSAPRQGGPDTTAADPARRPHCTLIAEVLLGATPAVRLVRPGPPRSTLGKGTASRALRPSQALDRPAGAGLAVTRSGCR